MNPRLVSALLFLLSAAIFLVLGLRAAPRNAAFIAVGVAFAIFGLVRLRQGMRR